MTGIGDAPACPFCEAADVELIALWGGQMITSQWRCHACNSYFEAIRRGAGEPFTREGERLADTPLPPT